MSFLRSAFRPLANQAPTRAASLCHVRLLSQDVRATIDKAVKADPLVLFMKGTPAVPQCGFSRAVVQLLDIHGVSGPELLKTYNVLEDQELRNAIKEYSQWPTIPQLYCKGEFVGGCDILLGMHQSGELEQLFAKEGLAPKADEPAPTGSSSA